MWSLDWRCLCLRWWRSRFVFIGILGDALPDSQREWLARFAGYFLLFGVASSALLAIELYGPMCMHLLFSGFRQPSWQKKLARRLFQGVGCSWSCLAYWPVVTFDGEHWGGRWCPGQQLEQQAGAHCGRRTTGLPCGPSAVVLVGNPRARGPCDRLWDRRVEAVGGIPQHGRLVFTNFFYTVAILRASANNTVPGV